MRKPEREKLTEKGAADSRSDSRSDFHAEKVRGLRDRIDVIHARNQRELQAMLDELRDAIVTAADEDAEYDAMRYAAGIDAATMFCAACAVLPAVVPVNDPRMAPVWCSLECAYQEALARRLSDSASDNAGDSNSAGGTGDTGGACIKHRSVRDVLTGRVKLPAFTSADMEQSIRVRRRMRERAKYERRKAKAQAQAQAKAQAQGRTTKR